MAEHKRNARRIIAAKLWSTSEMRQPKPALNAIYRANDGMRYTVLEVTDLPFIGQYELVLATEHEVRNGTEVASITDEEFNALCAGGASSEPPGYSLSVACAGFIVIAVRTQRATASESSFARPQSAAMKSRSA